MQNDWIYIALGSELTQLQPPFVSFYLDSLCMPDSCLLQKHKKPSLTKNSFLKIKFRS